MPTARPRKPPRPVTLGEPEFLELILKFARKTPKTTVEVVGTGKRRRIEVVSFDGMVDFNESPPSFHDTGWALWWGFRLLHPHKLADFDTQLRELFESFKRGERPWVTYNEEKRALLARYLKEPYDKRRKRK